MTDVTITPAAAAAAHELAAELGILPAEVVERALAFAGAARCFALGFHGIQEHPVWGGEGSP